MEGLSPPLKCLIEMQAAMQNGESARIGLARYLRVAGESTVHAKAADDFTEQVRRFLFAWDQGQDWRSIVKSLKSPHRRILLELASSALAGQPVLAHLDELRIELIRATESEIEEYLELLPVKMLIPLLFFQFPAFLLLLFGPLLSRLLEEISK